ncbi:hypothetical protein BGW80DRAFT_1316680 [Lactifluus volemus]|nr:hypothetical protein BGW80DRAFT_1316680 [Lactifluus volemus]
MGVASRCLILTVSLAMASSDKRFNLTSACKAATGGQGLAAGQQATGLLSGQLFSLGAPKHVPSIKDAFLTLFIAVVFHIFSIFKRFIPPFIWGFVVRPSDIIYVGILKCFTRRLLYLP